MKIIERNIRYLLLIILFILFWNISLNAEGYTRLGSKLERLVIKYLKEGTTSAIEVAKLYEIEFIDNKVTVLIEGLPEKKTDTIDEKELIDRGVIIINKGELFIRAQIPIDKIEEIGREVSGIGRIEIPIKPIPLSVTSEGFSKINTNIYHNLNYKGQNIKIAIIDTGFYGYTQAQSNGDLPFTLTTKDFTGTGISVGDKHGTAVAEIIYDIAPQSQLYLIKIADADNLNSAKNYCKDNGIKIICHSI